MMILYLKTKKKKKNSQAISSLQLKLKTLAKAFQKRIFKIYSLILASWMNTPRSIQKERDLASQYAKELWSKWAAK